MSRRAVGEVHEDHARVGGGAADEDSVEEVGFTGGGRKCCGVSGESVEFVCFGNERVS